MNVLKCLGAKKHVPKLRVPQAILLPRESDCECGSLVNGVLGCVKGIVHSGILSRHFSASFSTTVRLKFE